MTLTIDRPQPETDSPPEPGLTKQSEGRRSAAPRRRGFVESMAARIPAWMALAMAVMWFLGLAITFGVQPSPPEPAPEPTAFGLFISTALMVAIYVIAAGAFARQRWGLVASMGGGLVLFAAATGCFLDGHNGLWLTTQFLVAAGLIASSGAALKTT